MRPLDPRLLRYAAAARSYVLLTGAVGVGTTALVVVQAWLLAWVVSDVVAGGSVAGQRQRLLALLVTVLARAALVWVQERYGERAATGVVAQLRGAVVARTVALGPGYLDGPRRSEVTTLVTDGLEALRPYLTRYLPQLLLTAVVTPALLVVVLTQDLIAALTIAVTLPLVPVFMALVGWMTQVSAARRLVTMQRLGAQVLDLLAGLATLVALGRERGPAARVRALGEAHREATTATLRTAFLSTLVLELLTTLAVALVAVGVGLRLLAGDLDLRTALVVLILAPEVYLPLRQVGAQFHASVDGLAAAHAAFEVLQTPLRPPGARAAPDLRRSSIEVRDLVVRHPGRAQAAPDGLSLSLLPGTVTALRGPSGGGKTSTAQVLLLLRDASSGTVEVVGPGGERTPLAQIDPVAWHRQVTWVGQHPLVVPGTLRENAVLLHPGADAATLARAADLSGLAAVLADLPQGWATRLGHGGTGLSAGQRQRLALTRALLTDAALVVLDEPSAHLDPATEQVVRAAIAALRAEGRTVLLIAHHGALLADADQVVTLDGSRAGAC